MRHKHQGAEIQRALDLYRTGMSAREVAQEIDPGSDKTWVLKAVRKAGLSRSNWDTQRVRGSILDRKMSGGYVLVKCPNHLRADCNGYVREHLLVWEKAHHGQVVPRGMVVHHRDGNRANNHPDNLEMMTYKEHSKYLPRRTTTSRNGEIARIGEKFAEHLGVKLRKVDYGPDGEKDGLLIEIKTRQIGGIGQIMFKTDHPEADFYLMIALRNQSIFAVWFIPGDLLRGHKVGVTLTPNELRKNGSDPWAKYRYDLDTEMISAV